MLFAGPSAGLTGEAALLWRRLDHLPREVTGEQVDVLVPANRHVRTTEWVRVTRVERMPSTLQVDDLVSVHITRAVVDAARWLTSYDTVLSLASAAINAGRTTADDLRAELRRSRLPGSGLLRRVLAEADAGVRSIAEANALRLFRQHGLPEPMVNSPSSSMG